MFDKYRALYLTLICFLLISCAPANIKPIPRASANSSTDILVYRESSFNAGAVDLIFGAEEIDYVILKNNDYSEF